MVYRELSDYSYVLLDITQTIILRSCYRVGVLAMFVFNTEPLHNFEGYCTMWRVVFKFLVHR